MWKTLKTLGWVLWFFGYMLRKVPTRLRVNRLAKQGRLAERDALVSSEVGKWSTRLLRHIKLTVVVNGRENLPPQGANVVYASNHQSYLDIPVLLANLYPTPPLMGKGMLGKIPLLGGWMRALGCVFVDTKDTRSAIAALKQAEETVQSGKSMIIFPEGTRSQSDELGEFKGGAMRIAWKAGVPIVPIAVDGTWRGLEGNGFRLGGPLTVKMTVLPAMETAGLDKAAQKAMPARLEEIIRAAKAAH